MDQNAGDDLSDESHLFRLAIKRRNKYNSLALIFWALQTISGKVLHSRPTQNTSLALVHLYVE